MKFMAGLIVGLTISAAFAGEEHHKVIDCPAGGWVTLLNGSENYATLPCPTEGKFTVMLLPGGSGSGDDITGKTTKLPCHIKGPYTFGGGSPAGPSKIEPYETVDGNCYVDLVPAPGWKDGHVVDGGGGAASTKGQIICPSSDQNLPCVINDPASVQHH